MIMKKGVVIVDYNNVFTADQCSETDIEFTFSSVVETILKEFNEIDTLIIRIYAGWYQEDQITARGSDIMTKLGRVNPFPSVFAGRAIRGDIEIVDQINGVDFLWHNTYREKTGPRLVVNRNVERTNCSNNKQNCPVEILIKFTKSRNRICNVPGCTIQNQQVFIQYGQKMVDTMMACDILTYGEEEDTGCIFVLTDDVDLFPSMTLCRCKFPNVVIRVGTRNNWHVQECNNLSDSFNIQFFLLS